MGRILMLNALFLLFCCTKRALFAGLLAKVATSRGLKSWKSLKNTCQFVKLGVRMAVKRKHRYRTTKAIQAFWENEIFQ